MRTRDRLAADCVELLIAHAVNEIIIINECAAPHAQLFRVFHRTLAFSQQISYIIIKIEPV